MPSSSKFPERISGMSFDAEDHRSIQRLCKAHGVSASHVVRSCTGVGLQVYSDVGLRTTIEKVARNYSTDVRTVCKDALSWGLTHLGSLGASWPSKQTVLSTGGYPARIAGIAFSRDDHRAIQRVSAASEISEAQVVRDCVSIGMAAYDWDHLRQQIEDVVLSHGQRERDVVYRAIKQGLDEAVRQLRVRRPLLILDALTGDLARSEARNTEVILKLAEYVHGVMGSQQPERLPDDGASMRLRDDLLEYAREEIEFEPYEDDVVVHPDWRGTGNELRDLLNACRKDPRDEHDRRLAKYLAGRFAQEIELDRRDEERKRQDAEVLLELRGRQEGSE